MLAKYWVNSVLHWTKLFLQLGESSSPVLQLVRQLYVPTPAFGWFTCLRAHYSIYEYLNNPRYKWCNFFLWETHGNGNVILSHEWLMAKNCLATVIFFPSCTSCSAHSSFWCSTSSSFCLLHQSQLYLLLFLPLLLLSPMLYVPQQLHQGLCWGICCLNFLLLAHLCRLHMKGMGSAHWQSWAFGKLQLLPPTVAQSAPFRMGNWIVNQFT